MATEVQNCPHRAAGRCPDDWQAMTPTSDPRIRQCQACEHPVFLCRSRDDALFFSRHGWRVALAAADKPAVPADEPRPTWAEQLSHCFDGPNLTWAGSPAARWHARETLKAAIDDGATMHDISETIRRYLQYRGVPPETAQADLDKIRGLVC